MAIFTAELRTLIENGFDIGLQEYPIFDSAYRAGLNKKIIDHYFLREIGAETAGLFKFYLNRKMNEIMPYFNQLYLSELLEFNPLYNVDTTETLDRDTTGNSVTAGQTTTENTDTNKTTNDGTSESNGNSTGNSTTNTTGNADLKSVYSDTPQGLLSIGNIYNELYATNATLQDNAETGTSTTTSNGTTATNGATHAETVSNGSANGTANTSLNANNTGTEDYTRKVLGKSAGESYSELLLKFRETFLNIDMQVIDALADCFMQLYE